jgi:superfamily II DNA/RNA helicase
MVINYEIPSAAEDYVHRIGRTGRAGAFGMAVSLVAPEEAKYLVEIEKLIKTEIPRAEAIVPPARTPRPQRSELPRPADHSHASVERAQRTEHQAPRSRVPHSKVVHEAWFNKPYEPSVSQRVVEVPVVVASKPGVQVPALFMRRKIIQADGND